MRHLILLAAAVFSAISLHPAAGEGFDDKQPLICAPTRLSSCGPKGDCEEETAESMNVPQFLTIDVAQRQITGKRPNGEMLSTVIDSVHQNEQNTTLQGMEGPMMWGVMIDHGSGEMILTAGGHQAGFVAFGACIPGQVKTN